MLSSRSIAGNPMASIIGALWYDSCHIAELQVWMIMQGLCYDRNGSSKSNRPITHWGRVTHICVSKLIIIGSDNGLSPGRRQAIIWTNAGILLIWPLGTNFSEILIEIHAFSFKKMHLKMSSGKRRPFCLGLNVLRKGEKEVWEYGFAFLTIREESIVCHKSPKNWRYPLLLLSFQGNNEKIIF